jgi:hypothetical protein
MTTKNIDEKEKIKIEQQGSLKSALSVILEKTKQVEAKKEEPPVPPKAFEVPEEELRKVFKENP